MFLFTAVEDLITRKTRSRAGSDNQIQILTIYYSWIAYELQVGTSLGWRHNLVGFQIWDQFWIPQPKLHGAMYLTFSKT